MSVGADTLTVIMAVHNRERYVGDAVDSILDQSVPADEVVIVDDGSTDATPDILARYGDALRVIRQPQSGQFAATNRAVQSANGALLAFLDSDDLFTPTSLEVRLDRLRSDEQLDAVFGSMEQFLSADVPANLHRRFRFDPEPARAWLFQTMLIRRDAFARVGPVAEDYKTSANIDWMARAMRAGLRTVDIDDVVARRRIHGTNISIIQSGQKQQDLLRVVRAHVHRDKDKD